MSKKWTPEIEGEFFAIISYGRVESVVNVGTPAHELIAIGNCFKTQEEAEAAVPKFKEFFANLHKDADGATTKDADRSTAKIEAEESHDYLKKLTPEVFYRPDCPPWATFAAVNGEGVLMFFESYPERSTHFEEFWVSDNSVACIEHGYDHTDWINSIIRSPNIPDLPAWCVKDEWLYDHNEQEYAQVSYVDTGKCNVTLIYLINSEPEIRSYAYIDDCCEHARIRPFNPEELKELVGECLEYGNDRDLITSYDGDSKEVYVDNAWWTADQLLEQGYTLYGLPCGVFETVDGETHPKPRTCEQ